MNGLTSDEARQRLARSGPNELPAPAHAPVLLELARQLVHFFALMLWVAGLLALVAGLPQLAIAIFAVIIFNGVFAFVQEHRAERAAERLHALVPRRATVLRDGAPVTIDAAGVVEGDIVLLEPGDRVCADLRVEQAHGLAVDESLLTGESEPRVVAVGDQLVTGSFITDGEGRTAVVATGSRTRLASIAQLATGTTRPQTPMAYELQRVVRGISAIAVSIGIAYFFVSVLLGGSLEDGFLFAIGVTVALVPEALLPTVTLSLAMASQRMADQHVLVRRLESVETLGSTTFICTDKTGTLTRNEMTVVEAWTPSGSATIDGAGYGPDGVVEASGGVPAHGSLGAMVAVAVRCSTGRTMQSDDGSWIAQGDPMEAAIDACARRMGVDVDAVRGTGAERARFAFDPRRRRMSVVVDGRVLVKGAPDAIAQIAGFDDEAMRQLEQLTARGLRVLAVAARDIADGAALPATAQEAERACVLLGLLALEDPPRPDVADAIETCRRDGIRVAMVTGDHPRTAEAIAREVGLQLPGAPVLVGAELPEDDASLLELIDHDGVVLSRIDPETKLRIARVLREGGHVVAMTGDGVNDGPALRAANVGIAMGQSGTDVAREAADIVLLDDHFRSIVVAVHQGRAVYANIRRFLTYHLSDNVAELAPFVVWALSGGSIPLAIGVMQVLALDLVTDTLSAVALGAEEPHRDIETRPASGRLLDRVVLVRAFGLLGPAEALVSMTAFAVTLMLGGWSIGETPDAALLASASGAAFLGVVLGQAANAWACRSSWLPGWALRDRRNRLLVVAKGIELVLAFLLVLVTPIAVVFGHAAPTPVGMLLALCAVPAVLLVDAAWKWWRRRRVLGA